VRNSLNWLNSCKNHYKEKGQPLFQKIYGDGNHYPVGNEDIWLRTYILHTERVKEYFNDRPDDLLIVDWEDGDGWDELCEFLGSEIPDREFPHANKGKYTFLEKAIRKVHYLVDREGFRKKNRDL
jgi:hypothetical protein